MFDATRLLGTLMRSSRSRRRLSRGPGTVWMQSLPFSRLAGRMLASAPQRGGAQGEGSVLGGFGDLFGDSR